MPTDNKRPNPVSLTTSSIKLKSGSLKWPDGRKLTEEEIRAFNEMVDAHIERSLLSWLMDIPEPEPKPETEMETNPWYRAIFRCGPIS